MLQVFQVYKNIDAPDAGKVLFRLQHNERILSVKVCITTGELVIETDKPLMLEEVQQLLNVFPDLIIGQQKK